MSLVAAYSDSSEDEDENQFINKTDHISTAENAKKKLDNNGEVEQFDILDDEEWMQSHQNNPNSIFSNLPSSHKEASSFEETEEKDDEFLKIKPTLSDDVKHNLLDTFDKQENIKAFMNLPRPVKGGKKGTVKISLPSYTGGNDSEDEGGDVGEIGKVQESNLQLKKKSSLFTILPKPKNSVSVGANKNKVFQKQTNRSLIPHTLKKVPTSNKPKQNVMINTNDKVQDELSEDEEEILDNDSSNFFSLGKEDILTNNESDHFAITVSAENKSSLSKKVDMLPSSHSQPTLIIPLSSNPNGSITVSSMYPVTTNSTVSLKQNTFFSNLYSKDLNKSANFNACKDEKKIDCNEEFSLHPKTTYSDVTAPYGGTVSNNPNERMTNEVYEKCNANQLVEKESESFFAYGYQSAHEDPENISTAEPTDFYNQSNVDMPLDEDAIKALVGGKRKFRKEEINIIDVKGEDLQISKGEYLKNLTQESGYKPKVSKKDQPRKLEKRKHQITYLAYQAKEREHELRQAWSISRATRRDTQSKYGF